MTRMFVAGVAIVVLLAACGPAGPAATPGPGATVAPGVTPAPVAVTAQPVPTQGGVVVGGELASRFPTQIDGSPVTDVQVKRLADAQQEFGVPAEEIAVFVSVLAGVGIDYQTVEAGNATATVNGDQENLGALRVPGHDAAALIPVHELFHAVNFGDHLSPETIGGKSATVVRSQSGFPVIYMYANGDTLWTVDTNDDEEAGLVFAALP